MAIPYKPNKSKMFPEQAPTPAMSQAPVQQPAAPMRQAAPTAQTAGMAPAQAPAVNPVETQDYRELLNQQIMAESGKAQASKYLTSAMQASGVAQTGLAQSVLSGLEMGYQGQLAQNISEYNIAQEQRTFEEQQTTQSRASELAFTFLDSAANSDQLTEYYDAYYNQLNPQDQQAFDLLYKQRQTELAGTGAVEIATSLNAEEAQAYSSVASDVNNWIEFLNVEGTDAGNKKPNSTKATREASEDLQALLTASQQWGSSRNGATYKVIDPQGNEIIMGYRDGRWYKLVGYTGTVIKTFNLKQ